MLRTAPDWPARLKTTSWPATADAHRSRIAQVGFDDADAACGGVSRGVARGGRRDGVTTVTSRTVSAPAAP